MDEGDVTFEDVITLLDTDGNPFNIGSLDPEGIALNSDGTVFISSEGDVNKAIDPFIDRFSLNGEQLSELAIPEKFLASEDGTSGIRSNLAFESLTLTPDRRFLYTAVEDALVQDGTVATLEDDSAVRILRYDLSTGEPDKEFLYFTDPIVATPDPADGFANNGLADLVAIDNTGTLLGLERSFSEGVGNSLRLYEIRLQNTTDISEIDRLTDSEGELIDVDAVAEKRLLIDFGELGIQLDNSEGLALGPVLPDGRQSLIVVSDNNFSNTQITQFLAFGLDLNSIPSVAAKVETPSEIRFGDPENPDLNNTPDLDDPAIYVNPSDPSLSLVITTLKDEGLAVYDLEGNELQKISPDNIRYNNVDLVYGFQGSGRGGEINVDLAVASDRANDTLAIFQIDPTTRELIDITSPDILSSIFGIDDSEQTAYGLATYISPVSGKYYVFVSQREGDRIAQLELIPEIGPADEFLVNAEVVRTFNVPIPDGGELEDAQVEGMVVDRELGYLYVAQENFGIWKFAAEPDGSNTGTIVDTVAGDNLEADAEGLTIYYGADGSGYLLASSQGDNTFALYDRSGSNSYLGSFVVGEGNGIDSVEESDGADIINVPLGEQFPSGVLVLHDGSNDPQVVFPDPEEGEIQNFNTNFKYVDLADVANNVDLFQIDSTSFDPRDITPKSLINGIASGDTTQNSTVLWARSNFLGDLTFEYSTNSDFSTIAGTLTATVTNANLPIKAEISDLTAGTEYLYRVADAAGATLTGRFTTSAEVGTKTGLSFGVSGDWRGELAPYPAIANAAEKNLDFFVEHGDTIYADYASDAVKNPDGTRKEQAETLDEYRAKHGEVYSDRLGVNTWADLRASTSVLATIDDHEAIDDFAGGADVSTEDRFGETEGLINDTQLYENGLQAFQEYNPLRDEFYGETQDDRTAGERKLYRYNTYGSDAAVIVLDNRSFRDTPLEGANTADTADVQRFLTESLTEDRTMLGEVQLEDLKQDLLAAEENGIVWKFVMVPEPIQNFGPGLAEDRFEGYAKERTEILSFIRENNIENVVFIAADIHGTVVNNLTYQETPGGEQIPLGAWEISTGSVAFDRPFGPTVVDILAATDSLTPEEKALYNSLPIANDADSEINDKDDFLKQIINGGLTPFAYDPIGLNDNLDIADGLIDATLIQGDYLATHTFGWTEFDIDAETGQLRVITYGIDPYSEAELLENPAAIIDRTPEIVSEFVVNPAENTPVEEPELVFGTTGNDTLEAGITSNFDGSKDLVFSGSGADLIDFNTANTNSRAYAGTGSDELYASTGDRLFGGEGNDILNATEGRGNNRLYGGEGDDRFFLGANDRAIADDGNDSFFVGTGGNNIISGGAGEDTFWIVDGELPEAPNTITDFNLAEDSIAIAGLGISSNEELDFSVNGTISFQDTDLAVFLNLNGADLTNASFVFA